MSALWTPAYIALGSNLEQPSAQVSRAFGELAAIRTTRLVLQSPLYRSEPMGMQDQPQFVNAVAGVLTQLDALELLSELQAIEQRMGRVRSALRWGPRLIDLDLLMHGATRSDTDALKLPHPGIAERNFVLMPLADIAPDLTIPGRGSVRACATAVGSAGLQRLE